MRQIYYNIVLVGSKNCDFLCKITFYSYSKHSATFWCQLEVWIQEERSPTKQKRQRVSPFNSETQDRPNIDLIIVVIAGHEMKVCTGCYSKVVVKGIINRSTNFRLMAK